MSDVAPITNKTDWFEVRDVRTDRPGFMPTFDEIVTGPVDGIHIEQMSDTLYWMAIHRGDERLIVVFGSKNGRAHVAGRFEHE